MFADLLAELKKLQYQRSDSSPFASHVEFMQWSDKVAPRLSFDAKLQTAFKHHIGIAKFIHNGPYSNVDQVNEAIGILNQAVLTLENLLTIAAQASTSVAIEAPVKQKPSTRLKAWWSEWGWSVAIVTAVLGLVAAVLKLF